MNYAEEYSSDRSVNEQYFDSYDDISVHRVMLSDEPRMKFYKEAITSCSALHSGVVVDVGSGSGILSCWAAQANAAHILSIEASSAMTQLQQKVLNENNLSKRVTIINETCEKIEAEGAIKFVESYPQIRQLGGVAVVLSEWMGFYLFHEGMLQSVLEFYHFCEEVNKYLGLSNKIEFIPSHASLFAAPITLKPYYEQKYHSFWKDVHGVCMSSFASAEFESCVSESPLIDVIPRECLLHNGLLFWESELAKLETDSLNTITAVNTFDFDRTELSSERKMINWVDKTISVDGFTVWFCVSYNDHVLSTSPLFTATHWKQTSILFPQNVREEQLVSFTSNNVCVQSSSLPPLLESKEQFASPLLSEEEYVKQDNSNVNCSTYGSSDVSGLDDQNKLELTLTLRKTDKQRRCYTITCEINETVTIKHTAN